MPRARTWMSRVLGGAVVGYVLLLLFGGVAFRGCLESRVRDRLGRALDAEVTIGHTSLSVWRGRVELEDIVARRVEGGAMELAAEAIEVDVAGWGAALVDRDIDRVVVRGARMELSARGLAELATRPRRQRRPISIGHMVVEDMTLAVLPTALFPGLGRVEAVVTAADASDVELSSGLSWLRGISRLEGRVSVPGGIAMGMAYRPDRLTLTGGPLGPLPITVPLRMPVLDASAGELDYLRALATGVIRAAGAKLLSKKAVDSAFDALEDLMKR